MSFSGCARLVVGLLAVVFALAGGQAFAATESYGYDALGRLIRWVDAQGRTTEYRYDAVGNLLSVTVAGAAAPQTPSVTSVTPDAVRRGDTKQITITGTNLANVTVVASHAGLTFSGVTTAATQVVLMLAVADTVPLGAQKLILSLGPASAEAPITILPKLPTLTAVPAPIAVPPDNAPRNFSLNLSPADTVGHTVTLSIGSSTAATVSPATLVFAAGETVKAFQVTGKLAGNATLTFLSPTLAPLLMPVFVTAEFQGINTTFSPVVGVQVAGAGVPLQPGALASENIGVTVGAYVRGIAPDRVQVGTTATVTFEGAGIPANATASISPADGVTLGPLTVAPDGLHASVDVTALASAPTTLRRLALAAGAVPLPLARADADQLRIVLPTPEITAITPIAAVRGATIPTFTVFGRNLTGATGLQFSGGGITAGASPAVNANGTMLTTGVAVSLIAALGPRTVVVQTLSGSSDTAPTAANTFTVADQILNTVEGITSPLVGVNVEQPASLRPQDLFGPRVGVAVGPIISAVAPVTAAQSQSVTLVISGSRFSAPATVSFTPATGLTVGAASVAPDGSTISVPVSVDASAPLGFRVIQAVAGGLVLSFASPSLAQFLVTAPRPQVFSLDPSAVAITGNPLTLTIRGVNFLNASQVRVTPADGVTVGPPLVNALGDTITVSIPIAASAPPGPRVVTVVTPAGESDTTATAANTLNLLAGNVINVTPLPSSLVGVRVGEAVVETFPGALPSPLVGVQVGTPTVVLLAGALASDAVGIVIGPVGTAVSPRALLRASVATLSVEGLSLPADTVIALNPATGLTLGTTQVAADGRNASIAVTVAADAPLGARGVSLTRSTAPATPILFVPPSAPVVFVSPGAPSVESVQPINARQGETVALTVRGFQFNDLVAVSIEPPEGVVFDSLPVVSADRRQIDTKIRINLDAAQGARVIRVTTLGGQSSAIAAPANTFTILPP